MEKHIKICIPAHDETIALLGGEFRAYRNKRYALNLQHVA